MVRQMLSSTGRECISHISQNFHKVEPGLSRPMPALVSANPSFWTVKEETVSNAPMKMKKSKKKKM
jgi:plastocyanin domain-containing protein